MMKNRFKRLVASLFVVALCNCGIQAQTDITDAKNEKPNKDWTVYVKGFVQADVMLDFQDIDVKDGFISPSIVIPQNNVFNSNFSVRQSQFGIGIIHPADGLGAYFEIDFMGPNGTTAPRFRHGYIKWKKFTVGQTWSNLVDMDLFPNLLDFIGPDGSVFIRRSQIRYETSVSRLGILSVSIEDPNTPSIILPSDSLNWKKRTKIPMATAIYRYGDEKNYIKFGGLVTPISYDMKTKVAESYSTKTIWGFAGIVSGRVSIDDSNNFRFQSTFGKGYATNTNALNNEKYDAVPNPQNNNILETLSLINIVAIYEHWWTPKWSSVLYINHSELGNNDFAPRNYSQRFQNAGLNLVYNPNKKLRVGAEGTYGTNRNFAENNGRAFRLQFSTSLSF